MAELSLTQFVETLSVSGLLTAAQLSTLKKQLINNSLSAAQLAQILVRQKHLTEWQAAQLLKGQSGFVLQQYRLLYPIGRGGMGQVFCARNTQAADGQPALVAVKVMARKLTSNETLVSRFRREIRATSKLNSPHIVRTLDAGRVGKVDFMVMEYVNGPQVDQMASRYDRLPANVACDIVRQAAVGLQQAHEHQMVHRDIKPGNLMVHWDKSGLGIVKLMDMGLVLVLSDSGHEANVTRAGQVMGTPEYMSPEQGWDTAKVDIRSDIYSLGCTLFRLLTSQLPFTGTNPLQVLSQRMQRDAPSVQSVCDDIPDDVAEVVSRMTRRDPDARYQTPADVVAALSSISQPLTKAVLQTIPATSRSTAAASGEAVSGAGSSDSGTQNTRPADSQDGTYQQFLKEVQEASDVELLLATDPSDGISAATLPVFSVQETSSSPGRSTSVTSRRPSSRVQPLVFSGCGIAVVLIAAALLKNGSPEPNSLPQDNDAAVAAQSTVQPAEDIDADVRSNPSDKGELVVDAAAPEVAPEPATTSLTSALNDAGLNTAAAAAEASPDASATNTGSSTSGNINSPPMPTELSQLLPNIPTQKAIAGQTFRCILPATPLNISPGITRKIEAGPDAPQGLKIVDSGRTQQIEWDVPADVSGTVQFSLTGRLHTPAESVALKGSLLVGVEVSPAKLPEPSDRMPSAADLEVASEELRQTYQRTLLAARTTADRVVLANRLLELAYDSDLGATDVALLQIIDELAAKARATDVLLETNRLRALRYGTSELHDAEPLVAEFRKAGLNALQQEMIIEHALRLAAAAVAAADYALTEQLLQMAKSLINRSVTGASAALLADVQTAAEIAKELVANKSSGADRLRAAELQRLIERWQFRPLLASPTALTYIQASSTTTAATTGTDNGRSLWNLSPDNIQLRTETQPTVIGILDRSQPLDRCVLRFTLGAGSNCAQIIFGAKGTTSADFEAFRVILNASALGAIQSFRDGTAFSQNATAGVSQTLFDSANLVELVIEGSAVALRINGKSITQTQIPQPGSGLAGIAADLRRPAPRLVIRQPRILLLPENY